MIIIAGALASGALSASAHYVHRQKETSEQRVARITAKLRIASGLSQLIPNVVVDPSQDFNAYNTGLEIHVNQGLIDKLENDDELALVIGHEMSHSTLMHMGVVFGYPDVPGLNPNNSTPLQAILESQADKMGAYYMMRAGYDICKGREFVKVMNVATDGDFLNGDHPPNSYRYEQLNINCS